MARKARRPARRATLSRLPAPVAAALRDLKVANDPRFALLEKLTGSVDLISMWRRMARVHLETDRRGARGNGWVYEFLKVLRDSGALPSHTPAPYALLRPTDARKQAAQISHMYRKLTGTYQKLGLDYPVAHSGIYHISKLLKVRVADRIRAELAGDDATVLTLGKEVEFIHGLIDELTKDLRSFSIIDFLKHHAAVSEKMLLKQKGNRKQSTVRGRRVADQRQLLLLRRVAAYVEIAFDKSLVDEIAAGTASALFDLDYSRRDMHKLLTRRSAK